MHRNRLYILGKSTRSKPGIRESQGAYIAGARPKVLSLFSGAMGLDLGLEAAGFEVAGCLECNKYACETIRLNRPDLPLIEDDIRDWTAKAILSKIGVRATDIDLIVGGPPCPSFSTAGRRQSFDDPRGQVMFDFLRIVHDVHPQFFVMENVRGILSASLSHVPLVDRGQNGHVRRPEEVPGTVMALLNERFKKMGYTVTAQLVNAANYGVPQKRERVVFIGSRAGLTITLPSGDFSEKGGLFHRPWRTLEEAFEGLVDKNPEFLPISPNRKKYFKVLKSGQNWRDLPTHMIKEALGGAYESSGGKVGFFRRLAWDKPCPTVPTSPIQKSTALCHPDELRPLSVREYARVQQFPDSWKFAGSTAKKYEQIGNAVPVGLGYVIGTTVMNYIENLQEARSA